MPTYSFKNIVTGEIVDLSMKMDEKEAFLQHNPDYQSYFGSDSGLPVIDPVKLGISKMGSGFREVLKNIHQRTPGSRLNQFTKI